MDKASVIRRSVAGAGLGLAGAYAYHAARYRRAAGRGFDLSHPPAVGSHEFVAFIEALGQAPRRPGNRITILRNGCEIFPAMLEAISCARECINLPPTSTGPETSHRGSPTRWPPGHARAWRSTCFSTPKAAPGWTVT